MEISVLVPVFGIVFVFSIPLLSIWTEYKRDMALIDKGLYQREQSSVHPGWQLLLGGSILTGLGIAGVVISFLFEIGRPAGIPGLVLLFVGIALIVVYAVAREK